MEQPSAFALIASVPMVLGHVTPDEIPFELLLLLAGFLGGIGAERLRQVRARRR
jgi:hypothetical protein